MHNPFVPSSESLRLAQLHPSLNQSILLPGTFDHAGLIAAEVDYSKQKLTVDAEYRAAFGKRLAAVGSAIETFFDGVPQDIEGGLVAEDGGDSVLYIFQSRPQH
jgi:hypothetical protein